MPYPEKQIRADKARQYIVFRVERRQCHGTKKSHRDNAVACIGGLFCWERPEWGFPSLILAAHPVPLRGIAPTPHPVASGTINPLWEFPTQAYGQHKSMHVKTYITLFINDLQYTTKEIGGAWKVFSRGGGGKSGGMGSGKRARQRLARNHTTRGLGKIPGALPQSPPLRRAHWHMPCMLERVTPLIATLYIGQNL